MQAFVEKRMDLERIDLTIYEHARFYNHLTESELSRARAIEMESAELGHKSKSLWESIPEGATIKGVGPSPTADYRTQYAESESARRGMGEADNKLNAYKRQLAVRVCLGPNAPAPDCDIRRSLASSLQTSGFLLRALADWGLTVIGIFFVQIILCLTAFSSSACAGVVGCGLVLQRVRSTI